MPIPKSGDVTTWFCSATPNELSISSVGSTSTLADGDVRHRRIAALIVRRPDREREQVADERVHVADFAQIWWALVRFQFTLRSTLWRSVVSRRVVR